MHDLRAIRDNPEAFDAGLKRRGLSPRAEEVLALDQKWRAAETRVQETRSANNTISKAISIELRGLQATTQAASFVVSTEQKIEQLKEQASEQKENRS